MVSLHKGSKFPGSSQNFQGNLGQAHHRNWQWGENRHILFHTFQLPIVMMNSGQNCCLGIYDQSRLWGLGFRSAGFQGVINVYEMLCIFCVAV